MTRSKITLVVSAVALGFAASGCGMMAAVIGSASKRTVNMDKWEMESMRVSLRSDTPDSICPRQPVQMAIFARVQHKKRDKQKQLETWSAAPDKPMRLGKMGFDEFEFASEQGTVDEQGYFSPDPDVLATASSGFEITTTYRGGATPIQEVKRFVPTYECIEVVGGPGAPGRAGSMGATGASGERGDSGTSEQIGRASCRERV
jgi:hypothetical protein